MGTEDGTAPASEKRRDCSLHENAVATDETSGEENPGATPAKEPRELDLMVLELPTNTEGIELEIRSDSKTVVDWIGHAKQRTAVDAVRARYD